MKTVKIYTMTDAKSPKKQCAKGIYILAAETSRGVADLTKEEVMEGVTANQAELEIVIRALRRLREPCEIVIFTESGYVSAGIREWLAGWKSAGWKTAAGKEIKNGERWRELDELTQGSSVTAELKAGHNYRKWMNAELRRCGHV